MAKKYKRFVVVYEEAGSQIIVDMITGVNYLWIKEGYGGGLTPLLDRDGKPLVTPAELLPR
ncbi:DUF6440 family protein [Ruminococcus sp.]|uniref:DUF6440 family protein n=1 Tax=Ruminococcus sp. TaxID=41978 RepID=UPI0025F729CF|nr:DUF6440 family protein [Ruminococcus sp.]MBQ8965449.1 xylan 1,4-beta-xylosidase [Ruminococcus sp.]